MDGMNNSEFARAHADAITGYYPCCGIWGIAGNGTFQLSAGNPPGVFAELLALGLEVGGITPTLQPKRHTIPCGWKFAAFNMPLRRR